MNRELVKELRAIYPAGTRVELVQMDDPYRYMEPGLKGTVKAVTIWPPFTSHGITAPALAQYTALTSSASCKSVTGQQGRFSVRTFLKEEFKVSLSFTGVSDNTESPNDRRHPR